MNQWQITLTVTDGRPSMAVTSDAEGRGQRIGDVLEVLDWAKRQILGLRVPVAQTQKQEEEDK